VNVKEHNGSIFAYQKDAIQRVSFETKPKELDLDVQDLINFEKLISNENVSFSLKEDSLRQNLKLKSGLFETHTFRVAE
jgi:hypothetical protein